jgi:hypothetical protein
MSKKKKLFIPNTPYCYIIEKIVYPIKTGSLKDIRIHIKHCDYYDFKKEWCCLLDCEIMDECSECKKNDSAYGFDE